jgi:alpha-L-rhamnosidase
LFKDKPYPLLRWAPALPAAWDAAAARLYITGLGYFHVFVNGQPAGESALQPSWSNYNTTVPFVALDIGSMLQPSGNNTIDVWLGAGWFSVMPNLFWGRIDIRDALPHGVPQARALLYLPPSNSSLSSTTSIPSLLPMLPSSTMATGSPVLFSSIHLGETFDATRDVSQGPWSPAVIPDSSPTGSMQAETVPPIVITREVPAVSLQPLKPSQCGDSSNPNGCWIADFGENMAGIVKLKVRDGARGQRVTMRFGELVHVDGSLNVNTSNNAWKDLGACANVTNRPGEQMDVLILSGQPEQEWAPLFVYHGFRYCLHV